MQKNKKLANDTKPTKFSETFLCKNEKNLKKAENNANKKKNIKKTSRENVSTLSIFHNRIKIRIDGYNQNRLISCFVKENIKLCSIEKSSQKLMFIVLESKNKQKGIALIEKMCYNYSIVEISGIKPLFGWLIKRAGILVGAAIFTVIAIISNLYIWRIEISGNERIDELTIMRELSRVNVSVGKNKSFDSFYVQQALIGLEGVVECTVEVKGTTVKVKLIETKEYLPPENDNTPGDIISVYDAEITKITVSGGTGKVRIGDRVPSGSVLISRELFNSFGEPFGETKAKGSVYGKVVFSDTTLISTSTDVKTRTGKKSKNTIISLFGLKIGNKNPDKFGLYESITTESYAFYNTFLPIKVNQTTFYEIERTIEERQIDELVEEYKSNKILNLVIKAGGSEISTTVTKEEISKGLYRVHLYMQAEMLISKFAS